MNRYQANIGIGKQVDIGTPSSADTGILISNLFDKISPDNKDIYDGKATGSASDRNNLDFKYNNRINSINIPLLANSSNLYDLFNSFFQGSLIENEEGYYFYPYSYSSYEQSSSEFITILSDMGSRSRRMIGSVCNNISFVFNDSFVVFNSNFIGREVDSEYDSSGENYSIPSNSVFRWSNADINISDSLYESERSVIKNISISLSNNISYKHYNNEKVQKFINGDISGSGSFSVPFDLDINKSSLDIYNNMSDNNNLFKLVITWGKSNSNGASIIMNGKINSTEVVDDQEQNIRFSYDLVEDKKFSNKINDFTITDSANNEITFDLDSNITLINNVFPGDMFSDGTISQNIISIINYNKIEVEDVSCINGSSNRAGILRHPIIVKVNK